MEPSSRATLATPSTAPYTMVQVDDDTTLASHSMPRLTLTWSDVSYSVEAQDPSTKTVVNKPILTDVSGEALPGELLVVMGPSGAGKSSLMDCIAFRNHRATGSVLVNGHAWTKALSKHACYVLQDDMFYANLTVHEHLLFQAELRMGRGVDAATRVARVHSIMSDLGLSAAANTPIGDATIKGLSGGQRKRLSLATELLTSPSILFVDEPTSGLDSFMAETVVRQMQTLARKGHTIIATIHQPNSALFTLFDKLHLMAGGRTVYRGPAVDSVNHFAAQGLACPPFMNPTDYFMEKLVVMDDDPTAKQRVQHLTSAWAAHEKTLPETVVPPLPSTLLLESKEDRGHDALAHVRVLCRRNLKRLVRDVVAFRARVASTIVISLICGLVFLQLSVSQTGVQDFTGVLFFLSVNQFIFSANPEFITVPLEIPLVLREHNGGLYHVLSWYTAKNVSELPMQCFLPLLFLTPAYFLIGFPTDAQVFFTFYLFIALTASAATGVGYFISCAAKRVDLAPMLGLLLMLPFLLFGGLLINTDSTPVYFVWLEQVSPIRYCFHGLMRAFWESVVTIPCDVGNEVCRAQSGIDVLRSNGISTDTLVENCLVLLAVNLCCRVLGGAMLGLRAARHQL